MFEEGSARFGIQATLPTFSHIELNHIGESAYFFFNPSLAEHDVPCLSKQCRSRSVGF